MRPLIPKGQKVVSKKLFLVGRNSWKFHGIFQSSGNNSSSEIGNCAGGTLSSPFPLCVIFLIDNLLWACKVVSCEVHQLLRAFFISLSSRFWLCKWRKHQMLWNMASGFPCIFKTELWRRKIDHWIDSSRSFKLAKGIVDCSSTILVRCTSPKLYAVERPRRANMNGSLGLARTLYLQKSKSIR